MKKILSVLLALSLLVGLFSLAVADDPDEIPGTVEMPYAGLRFVPPQSYRDAAGCIVTDGAIDFGLDGIIYAYWAYFAMTEEEMAALYDGSSDTEDPPVTILFYVFSIGNGMTFDDLNTMIGNSIPPECVREIGKVGDWTFCLYMEGPDPEFAGAIDPAYADEYTALAGAVDDVLAAFTCYEPLEQPDPYAGLVGTKVEFTATDLEGNPVSSADLFAQNEITMINIWATWCGPCVGELAELQEIDLRLKARNCGIIGLLLDEDLDTAKQLVADNGVAYPVILAPENVDELFTFEYIPTSYFVDRNGIILSVPIVGADPTAYEPQIDELLAE